MTATQRVVAIIGAGGALGAAVSQQIAGEPATDLMLSDVSAASLEATVAGLPRRAARSRPCWRMSATTTRSKR